MKNGSNRGRKNFKSKLTEQEVLEIRANPEKMTQIGLAGKYGVSQSAISHIFARRTWAWLNNEENINE